MKSIRWALARDSILLFGILTFSLPLKTPAIQSFLESILQISFPIQLSTYTLFLPMWLGITVLIHLLRIPDVWRRLKVPLLLMLMLFVWMWLGAWFSESRSHSLKHAGRHTIYFFVFLTLLHLVHSKNVHSMATALVNWFLIITGLTMLERFDSNWRIEPFFSSLGLTLHSHYPPESLRLSSLFENPNPYGIVCVSILGISLYCVSNKRLLTGGLGVLAATWGIISSESRNALLNLIILILVYLFINFLQTKKELKIWLRYVLASIVLIVMIILIIKDNSPVLQQKLTDNFNLIQETTAVEDLYEIDIRMSIYREALLYIIEERPLLGSGIKMFGIAVFPVEAWNAHNALLTIFIEIGLVGFLLALAFLTTWFWKHRKSSYWVRGSVMILCLGQVFDYFNWQITFMTVQSLIFVLMAASSQDGSREE